MCTRFLLDGQTSRAGFARLGLPALAAAATAAADRYNIGPAATLAAVRHPATSPFSARWGFRPAWENSGSLLLNARCETLTEKPSFRDSFHRRRCLVPATGFYEWEKRGRARLPWVFRLAPAAPAAPPPAFAFAALWSPETETDSLVLVTTAANSLLARIHDRMPVLLRDAAACLAWLDPDATPADLAPLFIPPPADALQATPVSPRLNHLDFEGPACIAPATHGLAPRDQSPPDSPQLNLDF